MTTTCCFTGGLHEGQPSGRETTLHGLPCYISDPSAEGTTEGAAVSAPAPLATAAIVVIPDAVGWKGNNMRLLADTYARRTGARVYMPEFMAGHGVDEGLLPVMDTALAPSPSWLHVLTTKVPAIIRLIIGIVPFIYLCRLSVARPRVLSWFRAFRAAEGSNGVKIGTAGFCWGGKHVTLLCAADATTTGKASGGSAQPLIDCAFTAHPSNLAVPTDLQAVLQPLSISIGDADMAMDVGQVRAAGQILAEKGSGRHEVVILPGAKHGFATRGHPDDKKEMEHAQTAEDQAVAWWATWLGTNKG